MASLLKIETMKNLVDLSIPHNRIVVALDNLNSLEEVRDWVILLKDYVGYFKVGFQLIHSLGGPQAVQVIKEAGGLVFYDCKLHDTNDTMQIAAKKIAGLGVDIFNLHASAGKKAMKSVMEVAGDCLVAGVTVLTSMDEDECHVIYHRPIMATVFELATRMSLSKVPAIICSPTEAPVIKGSVGTKHLITITPGIRPLWAVANDQDPGRIMTPYKATLANCDLQVIGRPILQPPPEIGDPVTAARMIAKEIETGMIELSSNDETSDD